MAQRQDARTKTQRSAERQIKLALVVTHAGPLTFPEIREMLPFDYEPCESDDAHERERHRQKLNKRLQRDRQALDEHGLSISCDDEYRYRLDEQASMMPAIELADDEEGLLRCLCVSLLNDASYPLADELRGVLAKIGSDVGLPDMLPSELELGRSSARAMDKVSRALYEHKTLHFDYTARDGKRTQRDVEPFGFFSTSDASYIVAYDPSAGAERTFRLDRMGNVRVIENSGFEPRPFSVAEHAGLPFQFGEERFAAQVRFDAAHVPLARRLAAQRGSLQSCTDGGALWNIDAASHEELARWCIQQGAGVVPVAPEQAASAYAHAVRTAAAALASAGESGGAA